MLGVCTLSGRIDASTVPAVRQELKALAELGKTRLVVLMDELEFMSAAGLNCFVEFAQDLNRRKGGVKFAAPPPQVCRVMELMGLKEHFEVLESEESALQAFSSRD